MLDRAAVTRAVHPRVCGELACMSLSDHGNTGSSPRVRGTRTAPCTQSSSRRFIPACAGNSVDNERHFSQTPVHPRVCGELEDEDEQYVRAAGSSRVCGELGNLTLFNPTPGRFIPACAGNSAVEGRTVGLQPVHPRVCGELASRVWTIAARIGSSPRVRGTRRTQATTARRTSVHPRVCGELRFRRLARGRHDGSSPRVRGTLADAPLRRLPLRFIPACAGNSGNRAFPANSGAVHPRVCGELSGAESGRSMAHRFIPACAGNSTRHVRHRSARSVHPRVCGELLLDAIEDAVNDGSSPRVRGTRHRCGSERQRNRFIPACAGNSATPWLTVRSKTVHPRVCGELFTAAFSACWRCGSSPRVRGTPRQVA